MTQPNPDDQQNPTGQRTVLLATDCKNSVLGEIEASNLNSIAYSPYGKQSAQHEIRTRIGFNGELREMKPEWYLLGAGYRAYNPRLMRFHSPDSWSPFGMGERNAYAYCSGEPVMNSDPTGHHVFQLFSGILSKLLGGVGPAIGRASTIATKALSNTISTFSRSASQVADVLGSSKKALSNSLLGSAPFPGGPPPRFIQKRAPNRILNPNVSERPSSVRAQQAEAMRRSGINAGTARTNLKTLSNNPQRSSIRSTTPAPARDTYTNVLDRHGNLVAVIRTTS